MKQKLFLPLLLAVTVLLAGCAAKQEPVTAQTTETGKPYEPIPKINGYYNGEEVWFIHPDVSNAETSEKLTRMISYKTLYVPQHAAAVDAEKLAKLYVFTNGIDHSDAEPWGGGPFGYQIDIFDSIPGQERYTSLRQVYAVTWEEDAKPRILRSEEALLAAEQEGELTITASGVVVNVPMVQWPGGSTRLEKR